MRQSETWNALRASCQRIVAETPELSAAGLVDLAGNESTRRSRGRPGRPCRDQRTESGERGHGRCLDIEVGEGAVVAAGSVVLRAVPPFAVVAGNPAIAKQGCRHPFGREPRTFEKGS